MMGSIYKNASKVVAWLGRSGGTESDYLDEAAYVAMDCLRLDMEGEQ